MEISDGLQASSPKTLLFFYLTDVQAARKENKTTAIIINFVLDFILPSAVCLYNYNT